MIDANLQSSENNLKNEVIKEEIEFQYARYLVMLFTIYLASLVIPALLFMTYMILFFLPHFLETTSILSLFTEIKPILALISMPLVFIGCYLFRLFFVVLTTRFFWRWSEKKVPTKDGIIPRNFTSRVAQHYHIRSFVLKYGKNLIMKGPFPWLYNWLLNFIGVSKIGKGTTIEEAVASDRYIDVGKNCYIGVNSAISAHAVEGLFGNISYFEVKVGNNVTSAGVNIVGPGSEVHDNSYLLPLASAGKHSVIKGNNYYWGIPLRKIFKKKIMQYLDISPQDLEKNENIEKYIEQKLINERETEKSFTKSNEFLEKEQRNEKSTEETIDLGNLTEQDLKIDFTSSSAISRVNIKFLVFYIPIFWISGMLIITIFYTFISYVKNWLLIAFFMPAMLIILWFLFIMSCFFFSKLFLILINLIHKPKEGLFKAEKGDNDFEFWCLRTELKKIVFWLIRSWPLPWMDILAFKWFGIKMTLSSSLYDTWCDGEFIKLGRRDLIGQGATIMSSMVVGKYLIIKKVIVDDYALIGGYTAIAPGTRVGKESIIGALSTTTYNQKIDPGWIYMGIPASKFKPNKYAESHREILVRKDVDGEEKFEVEYEVNVDEDKKKHLA
ncbi:MAG: hypothetical protein ACFFFT_11815 [Candidatus Thorarchaeota archaeon]